MGGSTHSELGVFTYKSVNKYAKDLPSSILMEAYSQVEYSSQITVPKLISIALYIFHLILFTVLWRKFIAIPILHMSKWSLRSHSAVKQMNKNGDLGLLPLEKWFSIFLMLGHFNTVYIVVTLAIKLFLLWFHNCGFELLWITLYTCVYWWS